MNDIRGICQVAAHSSDAKCQSTIRVLGGAGMTKAAGRRMAHNWPTAIAIYFIRYLGQMDREESGSVSI